MAKPADPDELTLVVKAIRECGDVTGCLEWKEKAAKQFRLNSPVSGLTPDGVKQDVIRFVREGGEIIQVVETREEYNDRPFYYKVILPFVGFTHGLFVELVLTDDDPDYPSVQIVNCHEQLN